MPPRILPPRLYLEPARKDRTGRVTHEAAWVVTYRNIKRRTGCGEAEVEGAARALADYVAELHVEKSKDPELGRTAAQVPVADVLAAYAEHKTDTSPDAAVRAVARPKELLGRIEKLIDWWGEKTLADVTRRNCEAYAKWRGKPTAARRDLEDFQAAISLAMREGICREIVEVTLPPKAKAREGYLTTEQVAALLRYCLHHRVTQTVHRGPRKGEKVLTKRRTLRHIAPFILTSIYTASRSGRVHRASFEREVGRPWIDLDRGLMHRMWAGEKESKKRAATIRLPRKLLDHLRRWQRGPLVDGVRVPRRYLVEIRGKPVNPRLALERAMDTVFGDDHGFVIHHLRHTSVTWLMQAGVPIEEVADYASMTPEMVRKTYGKFHPDTHRSVGDAFSERRAGRSRDRAPRRLAETSTGKTGKTGERVDVAEPAE